MHRFHPTSWLALKQLETALSGERAALVTPVQKYANVCGQRDESSSRSADERHAFAMVDEE